MCPAHLQWDIPVILEWCEAWLVLQQFPASWRINGSLVGLVIVQDFWVPTCSNKPWSLKVAEKKHRRNPVKHGANCPWPLKTSRFCSTFTGCLRISTGCTTKSWGCTKEGLRSHHFVTQEMSVSSVSSVTEDHVARSFRHVRSTVLVSKIGFYGMSASGTILVCLQ